MMISSMIRNQINAETQNSNIFSNNEIFETITSSKAFEIQNVQQLNENEIKNTSIIDHVSIQKTASINNKIEKNLEDEYHRLLAIKKKTQQAKKIMLIKKQENKN